MPEKQIKITRFDGGMAEEDRDLGNGYFKYLENVNAGEKARGLKQERDVVGADSTRTLLKTISVDNVIYGLGKSTSGGNFALYKSIDYGATFSEINPASTSTFLQVENPFLVYYQGYIYFYNGIYIGKYTVSSGAITGDWLTLGIGGNTVSVGVQWQGELYGFSGQRIYAINIVGNTFGEDIVKEDVTFAGYIDIPTDQAIVELVPYGNLMAVICKSSVGDAVMYLWDGVTTTSFYDIISIGDSNVAGTSLVDGVIKVVVSDGLGFKIKQYNGNTFTTELNYLGRKNNTGDNFTYVISRVKTHNNFLYFLIGATRPNTNTTVNSFSVQLARYGSQTSGQQKSLSVYKDLNFVPSSITRLTDRQNDFNIMLTTSGYYAIFCAIQDNASTLTIKEIRTTTTTALAGIIETSIFTGGDSSIEKKLSEMSIMCEPLTTGQSIKLSYKPDADTTWTEIQTIDTVGTITYEPVLEADGSNLRTSKEVAFRFELLGGAELTGFTARYEEELGQR